MTAKCQVSLIQEDNFMVKRVNIIVLMFYQAVALLINYMYSIKYNSINYTIKKAADLLSSDTTIQEIYILYYL